MSTVTLAVPIPAPLVNANARGHWAKRHRDIRAWRAAAFMVARRAPKFTTAHVTVLYRFPDNRRREVSNLQPTSKALVDGLVDAGLVPDDSDRYITGPDNRREYPNGPLRVTVHIEGASA